MIKLDDKFYIESDGLQITLYKEMITEKGDNVGKVYGVAMGYYNNLEQAIKGYARQVTYDLVQSNTNLKDLVNAIKELNRYIENITKGE